MRTYDLVSEINNLYNCSIDYVGLSNYIEPYDRVKYRVFYYNNRLVNYIPFKYKERKLIIWGSY